MPFDRKRRSEWWFSKMRQAVDNAFDWKPPEPPKDKHVDSQTKQPIPREEYPIIPNNYDAGDDEYWGGKDT